MKSSTLVGILLGIMLLGLLLSTGCAHRRVSATTALYWGPECIEDIHKGEKTWCEGPDAAHSTCYRIPTKFKPGCEVWKVKH